MPPWSGFLVPRPGAGLLADQLLYLAPWRQFLREELLTGSFPLWNPFILGGVPFAACVQAAPFHPLSWGLFWLSAVPYSLVAAFLKVFAAAFFTGLHARRLGASARGAAVAALVFGLGGFIVAWLGHPHSTVACLLPALFWTLGRLSDEPSAPRAAALGLAVGLVLLGGHPPTALHVLGAAGAYALFLFAGGGPGRARFAALAAAGAALGACLAAPALLPFLEYHPLSATAKSAASLARWGTSLSPWTALHLFMPLASGSPALGAEVLGGMFRLGPESNFVERAAWTGIVPLALAALALLKKRPGREAAFHAGLALFGLAAALGAPPLPWLWKIIPGVSAANPTRLIMLWTFGVAVLAALGSDLELNDLPLTARQKAHATAFVLAVTLGLFYWATVWNHLDELELTESFFATFVVALFVAECAAAGRVARRREGAVGLTALFLLIPALGVNTSAPASTFYPAHASIAALKDAAGEGRAFALGRALEPDLGMPFRVRDARGRDFATPRLYEELVTGRSGDFDFWSGGEGCRRTRPCSRSAPRPRRRSRSPACRATGSTSTATACTCSARPRPRRARCSSPSRSAGRRRRFWPPCARRASIRRRASISTACPRAARRRRGARGSSRTARTPCPSR
ncbi:MAG: hypothetical protein M0D55_05900 [Elusimicrobiota bacterium]|nr:MAG: hypothetical protein M0D55_05900 [Elusimicrobiota bacterium]